MKAFAITSLVLGILGLLLSVIADLWIVSLIAVIFAIVSIIKKLLRPIAIIGIVLGIMGFFAPIGRYLYDIGYSDVARNIFQVGREWSYKAFFIDTKEDTIDSQRIILRVLDGSPNRRINIRWCYRDTSLNELTWVIENDDEIKLHPPTKEDFYFTELSVFPHFTKPLRSGDEWIERHRGSSTVIKYTKGGTRKFFIKTGKSINEYYKITGQKEVPTLLGDSLICWQIDTRAESGAGIYKATFYFHPDYGFVRWEYTKPDGEQVILDLEKVSGFEN